MDEGLNIPIPEPHGETGTFRAFAPEQSLFNRYRLQHELGRGGRGVVWLAHDRRLECDVALKFLADQLLTEPDALDELRHETLLSRKITHPHIMRIYDFEQDDTAAAISMEYLDGSTLSQLRVRRPHYCFNPDELRPWVIQLCEALYYAHTGPGVVHRDLKPSNLMVGGDGRLRVTDFGIASVIADSMSRVTQMHSVSGTLPYMSPQQALGSKPRETDDIYSMGAVIYELLTSKPPFYRGNVSAQIQSSIAPPMHERRAELGRGGDPIPPLWEEVVAACLAKDPRDRPPSAKTVADWIQKGFRSDAQQANAPTLPVPLPMRKATPLVTPLLFGGAFLLGGALVWIGLNTSLFQAQPAAAPATSPPVPEPAASQAQVTTPPAPVESKPVVPDPEPAKPPKPPTGSLIVNTTPSGATVYLGDDKVGISPLSLADVPVGSQLLRVEREGYEKMELFVDIRESGMQQPPLLELVRKAAPATPMPLPTPAPTPRPTPPPATPAPAPPPVPADEDAAIGRVVTSYILALESQDVSDYVALCGPKVDFFDEGTKTPDVIRRNRSSFMKLWTNYRVLNMRNLSIRNGADDLTKTATFTYEYRALFKGKGRDRTGTVTDTLEVRKIDGQWLITKMRQATGKR